MIRRRVALQCRERTWEGTARGPAKLRKMPAVARPFITAPMGFSADMLTVLRSQPTAERSREEH